ncbi:MAG: DUF2752 domain-containing protein [Firmicutes bacterium]|nr:DUF2752 domain-containing protein [Bacillota bacterium]
MKRTVTRTISLWPFYLHLRSGPAGPERFFLPAATAGALILPFFLPPEPAGLGSHTRLFLDPCLFYRLTGLPCPLCGMTTSLGFLVRGRFFASLGAHPLGWLAFFELSVATLTILWAVVTRRAVSVSLRVTPGQFLAAILLLWVVRLAVWRFGLPFGFPGKF